MPPMWVKDQKLVILKKKQNWNINKHQGILKLLLQYQDTQAVTQSFVP